MTFRPDPKLPARVRLSPSKYLELVAEAMRLAGGMCECGCGRRADSAHHLVARSQRGDDVLENIVVLAGDGTRLCHGALEAACRTWDSIRDVYIDPADVRSGIRSRLEQARPATIAYLLAKKGAVWLERRYPPPAGS